MGGMGNVSEMHAALLSAIARRIGISKARACDPWFYPDEKWMRAALIEAGFEVEKAELEYRPTPTEKGSGGGVEGWVRVMGKQFFDAVAAEGTGEREECVREVVDVLDSVCEAPDGERFIGYVRLRVRARKV